MRKNKHSDFYYKLQKLNEDIRIFRSVFYCNETKNEKDHRCRFETNQLKKEFIARKKEEKKLHAKLAMKQHTLELQDRTYRKKFLLGGSKFTGECKLRKSSR